MKLRGESFRFKENEVGGGGKFSSHPETGTDEKEKKRTMFTISNIVKS